MSVSATGSPSPPSLDATESSATSPRHDEPREQARREELYDPPAVVEAWIVAPEGYEDAPRLWGLDPIARTERILRRLGVPRIRVLAPDEMPRYAAGPCVVVSGAYFLDQRLVEGLLACRPALLRVPESAGRGGWLAARATAQAAGVALAAIRASHAGEAVEAPSQLPPISVEDAASAYNPGLRKLDPPFAFRAMPETVRAAENHVFRSSYKGLTDLVTKWVWPLPARLVTRVLVRLGIQPNTITALSWVFAIATPVLFVAGQLGAGLVSGWIMTFLDTVDGKLARCTLTTSRIGHVMDHGLDLTHPPIWWIAFGMAPQLAGYDWATWVIVGGYLVGRALEGVFMLAFDFEIFLWRPFDGFFRTIIARRNPNLLLLSAGVLAGRPELGFVAVAIWTLVSNGVHAARLLQAGFLRVRGRNISPWYASSSTELELSASSA